MLHIAPQHPRHAEAAAFIAALSAELAERYPEEGDGSGNFRADDVAVPRSIFLVAWLGSEPAGCGALRPFAADDTAELKRMYVAPALRGRGIGREILRDLVRHAFLFRYSRLVLETGVRQPEAIALYTKTGFHQIPRYGIYADNPLSVCFEKLLTADAIAGEQPAA